MADIAEHDSLPFHGLSLGRFARISITADGRFHFEGKCAQAVKQMDGRREARNRTMFQGIGRITEVNEKTS